MQPAFETDVDYLLEQIHSQISGTATAETYAHLPFFVQLSIPATNLLTWLKAQRDVPQWYWSSRDGETEIAGVGQALRFEAESADEIPTCIAALRSFFEEHPQAEQLTCFVGMRFAPDMPRAECWQLFPAFLAILPAIAIVRDGDEYRLLLQCELPKKGDDRERSEAAAVRKTARAIEKTLSKSSPLEAVTAVAQEVRDEPSRADWLSRCESALSSIAAGEIEKIVVARAVHLALNESPHPVDAANALRENLGVGYSLMYAPRKGHFFACQSPERLFSFSGSTLQSDALGGSTLYDADSSATPLGQSDAKLSEEHQYVVRDLLEKYGTLADGAVSQHVTERLALPYIAHLRTQIAATARAEIDALSVLQTLHPTPAVGTYPSAAAAARVSALEQFDRGWYSGPVGILRQDSAEFAVALRGVVVNEKEATVFAGAGVVHSSSPELEWEEIQGKLKPVLELFLATGEQK